MPLPTRTVADPGSQQNFDWLVDMLGGRRIVSGLVNTATAAITGKGFTVVRNGVGDVTITFTSGFGGQPAVTATPCETAGALAIKGKDGVPFTRTSARFQSFTPDTPYPAAETIFSFVAIGPA